LEYQILAKSNEQVFTVDGIAVD